MSADEYGRSLTSLSLNLLVRDIALSLPFYTEVLGFTDRHHDPDFAALERDGVTMRPTTNRHGLRSNHAPGRSMSRARPASDSLSWGTVRKRDEPAKMNWPG